MAESSKVLADVRQETPQTTFDFAPDLAAMAESSTVDSSDCEEEGSEDDGDSDGGECLWPRLSEAALLAHMELIESCKRQGIYHVSLHSSEEPEVGSVSSIYFSAHSKDEFVSSDGTSSQSSVSDAASEPRSPPGPHGAGECSPCCFFARGICMRKDSCSYCHEHPYVARRIKFFRKCSRSLELSSEEASSNIFA